MMNTNLIIGKTGSLKTTGILFKEVDKIIDEGESLIILDKKEEYYKTFKEKLDKRGYKSLVLNLKDAYKSNSFNPLWLPYKYYKEGNKDKSAEIIRDLGTEIFRDDNKNSDPFWSNASINYFVSLVLILFKEAKEDEINLYSVQVLLSMTTKDKGKNVKDYFDNLDPLDTIYMAGSGTVYAPSETKSSIISVINQRLNVFCIKEQLLNNLAFNDIDLSNLDEKSAIFVICDDLSQRLGNVLIDQVASLDKKFTYVLDNFDGVLLSSLNDLLDRKERVYVAIRNEKEFTELYGNYTEDKFENIMDDFSVQEKMKVGNYNDYPKASFRKVNYFDAAKFFSKEHEKNKGDANFIDFVNKEIKSLNDFDVK